MTIRLFVEAKKRWAISMRECAELFDRYGIDEYIASCYGLFHMQGDLATLDDIEEYMAARGYVA